MANIDGPVDANGAVRVAQPLNPLHAGFGQLTFVKSAAQPARTALINAAGELSTAQSTRLFDAEFNGPAAGALVNNQFNQAATTMTGTLTGGFLRLNTTTITTINTGIGVNTWQTFGIIDDSSLKLSCIVRHANGAVSNKQADIGFGFYGKAAGQAATMNEFIGFRWTTGGGLIGVLEYSVGGAPTSITVNLNGGVPLSNDATHVYEMFVGEEGIDFWIDGSFMGYIAPQPDASGIVKGSSYPFIARLFNAGSAPALAPVFDIGNVVVSRIGGTHNEDRPTLQVAQGRHSGRAQAGLQTSSGITGSVPASGTGPGALVASNTVSGLVGLGGYGRVTLTGVVATAHTELIMNSFQNPSNPEAVGVANNPRSLIITDIMISPLIVTTLLAGGGFSAEWFLAYGSTALSLATADAIGTTAPGAKSPTKIPLPIIDTLGANAAAGTIATRTGEQGLITLATPIVIAPGEFIHLGLRTLFVTAAVTAGAADFGIGFSGYWQ